MHEDTQRRLVRTAFLLCCLLPTALLLALAVARALPYEARRLERRLSQELGLDIRIQRVEHPRPRQLRLAGVTVADVESHASLATLPQVTATRTQRGWHVRLDSAAISTEQLPVLWHALRHRVLPLGLIDRHVSAVVGDELTLQHDKRPLKLRQFRWLRADRADTSVVQFDGPGEAKPSPIRLTFEYDRTRTPHFGRLTLDTGAATVPVTLLMAAAGTGCDWNGTFQGQLPIEWTRGGWSGRMSGRLKGLDLAQVATGWLPYKVGGDVNLHVEQCAFDARGLQTARGHLQLASVALERQLLEALFEGQLVAPGPAYVPTVGDRPVRLPAVDLDFSLTELGLICRSAPDPAGLRVAATGSSGAVLLCDGHVRVDWLIRALVPEETADAYAVAARWQQILPPTLPRLKAR
jgi:hypothetical protein